MAGEMRQAEAARVLGVSGWQVRRMVARVLASVYLLKRPGRPEGSVVRRFPGREVLDGLMMSWRGNKMAVMVILSILTAIRYFWDIGLRPESHTNLMM